MTALFGRTETPNRKAILFLLALAVLLPWSAEGAPKRKTRVAPSRDMSTTEMVQRLVSAGIITRINAKRNEVQVNGSVWRDDLQLQTKRGMIILLSNYFKGQGESSAVVILDNRSGKKLGENSAWSGPEVYE